MTPSSSITNYQTSFRLQNDREDTFEEAVRTVYDWLCQKEKDRYLRNGWGRFKYRYDLATLFGTRSRVQTNTCVESEKRSWVCEYTHSCWEFPGQRFWHNQVGIRQGDNETLVSVRNSYSWNQNSLSPNQQPPNPTVPNFVRQMVQNFKAYSGRPEFQLKEFPLPINKVGMGKLLSDFIQTPERRYPLLVFNGESREMIEESNSLAKALVGKVQTVIIAENGDLAGEIRHTLPKELWIQKGTVRVFFPIHTKHPLPARHRFYTVSDPLYQEEYREGIINGLLRNHQLQERGAITSLQEVDRLIGRVKMLDLREKLADSPDLEENLSEFYSQYEALQDDLKFYEGEAETAQAQVSELNATISQMEWKMKAQRKEPSSDNRDIAIPARMPTNILEVSHAIADMFPDRLDFSEDAFISAEKDKTCPMVGECWEILYHLANTLYDLKFTKGSSNLAKEFQGTTGYEYAPTEGKQTKADAKLCALREIRHRDKKFTIWPHIKKGNKGRLIRIHFDYDEEEKLIVVGFVGEHMDNASTRGRK